MTAPDGDTPSTSAEQPRRGGRSPLRSRIAWLPVALAVVLALVGITLLIVGSRSSRPGPPQPSAAAAGTLDQQSPAVGGPSGGATSAAAAPAKSGPPTSTATSSGAPSTPSVAGSAGRNGTSSTSSHTSTRTSPTPAPPTRPPATTPTSSRAGAAPDPLAPPVVGPVLARSEPTRITIASIGVNSTLLDLGLNPDGTVEVPSLDDPDSKAGWFHDSPTPGVLGPAIILGHIDSLKYGPGVFYDLGNLKPGAAVEVTRRDGTVAVFKVDGVRSYPKNAFPTLQVYGNIDHAGLRLITCGGTFDPAKGSYESNIVAFASLVSSHRA